MRDEGEFRDRDDERGRERERGREGRDRDWVERREGPNAKLLLLAAVLVLLVVFVVQNTDRAQVDFLVWNGDFPLWTMIVVAAVLGLIAGWVIGRIGGAERRARRAEGRLRDDRG